jgi:hypothetical protein
MARMYPNRLDPETQSHAERLLYEGFRDELDNSYTVFHSVHWQSLDGEGRPRDGEADFVIAHPGRGILVIEAKGGGIRNDPRTGEWISIDRGGRSHHIKDPFGQARYSKYSLEDRLRIMLRQPKRRINLGHAVAFPDTVVQEDLPGLDKPREIVLDATDLANLSGWVGRALGYYRGGESQRDTGPGSKAVEALMNLLGKAWELRPVLWGDFVQEQERRGVEFRALAVNPSDVSPESWCDSFGTSINEPMGIALMKAIRRCRQKYGREGYFISEIASEVLVDPRANDRTIDALVNRLEMADQWGIFASDRYHEVSEVMDPDSVNVLDLSVIDSGRYGRRGLILSVLCRDLFRKRSVARRREELGLAPSKRKFWLLIDEAHQFAPVGKSALGKEDLIRWVKEGRQPGLSLVVASQQPSAIDSEILSQCDAILSHALTTRDDKAALNRLTKDYMKNEIKAYINQLARTGQAVFVDDDAENIEVIQIRPRTSKPGGSEG